MAAVLYTRRGCRLCEEAEDLLVHHGWNVDLVDVDADVTLRARFGDRVPVLEVDGRVVAEGRFDEATLPARDGTNPPSPDRPRPWWGTRQP